MNVRYHVALQELELLSQCDHEHVAELSAAVLAAWAGYQQSALELDDFASIVQRNYKTLSALPQTKYRDLAQEALEDLL